MTVACPGTGGLFVKAGRVVDDCGNWLGQPFPQGPQGIQGPVGPQGIQGPQGVAGPSPEYQWAGTQLRIKQPNGTWGNFVDLGAGIRNFTIKQVPLTFTGSGTYRYSVRPYIGNLNSDQNTGVLMAFSIGSVDAYRYGWWANSTEYMSTNWDGSTLTINTVVTGGGYFSTAYFYATMIAMCWKQVN